VHGDADPRFARHAEVAGQIAQPRVVRSDDVTADPPWRQRSSRNQADLTVCANLPRADFAGYLQFEPVNLRLGRQLLGSGGVGARTFNKSQRSKSARGRFQ
jgi:hypothetical protein